MELSGNNYQIGRLNAFDQLKIARKLAATSVLIGSLVKAEAQKSDITFLVLLILSHLDDASSEQVVNLCLGAVSRQQGTMVAPIMNSGTMMFSDIGVSDILQLTSKVITENLGNFFLSALADLEAKTAQL